MARTRGRLMCSFCGKHGDQVQRLISGPGVYICDGCVNLCNEILAEDAHLSPGQETPHASTHQPPRQGRMRGWRRLLQRWHLAGWQIAHDPV